MKFAKLLIVALGCVVLSGCCQTAEHLGTFGDLEVHSFYARPTGAPAVTGIASVRDGKGQLESTFSQKDLGTTAVEGLFGVASSAVYGLSYEAIRGPDEHNESINVHGGTSTGGDSSATGGDSSATAESKSKSESKAKAEAKQKQKQQQKQKQRQRQRQQQRQNQVVVPRRPRCPRPMPMPPMGGGD